MTTETAVAMTFEKYMTTYFQPDREWIDGELKDRNLGTFEHARIEALLAGWFLSHEKEWGVMVVTEQRTQVAPRRIRIPDVALLSRVPHPDVIVSPPILAIEILSPEDSYTDTQRRATDYSKMGVSAVWIIDPSTRTARFCTENAWTAAGEMLVVPGTPIYLSVVQLFKDLEQV